MRAFRPLAALLAVLATPALAKPAADPAQVVAAERAFAADGLAFGIKQSFLKWSAPEAILFAPDPVKAHDLYGSRPDKANPPLVWWPVFAGISRGGDLGFTTGPATFDGKPSGWYFTVWARQADGGWKWVYDGGVPAAHGDAPPQGSAPVLLAPATGPSSYPEGALSAVKAAEARLAAKARTDVVAAYKTVLLPQAHVMGSDQPPAATPQAVAAELARRPKAIRFSPLGGSVAVLGDLAWTYGDAAWDGGRGHYVRIWRHDRDGWRIAFDEILEAPPPKA
ncbi:nuclear transport factor 2 family protein [Phenylobacterium sp.]|uniref:nuclear transport factor 2 family protein n=1 Tax=Phenylobacterium sp. TaxID=1871053 RepID=UPI0035B3A482